MNASLLFHAFLSLFQDLHPEEGLKDAFTGRFMIGASISPRLIGRHGLMICKEFNSLTADNSMKPSSIMPHKGEFNWTGADRIADFCRKNNIKLRGHTLMWHKQIGSWMYSDEEGNLLSKEAFFANMREYIHSVVCRYKDIVYAWDVVNEAIAEHPCQEQPLRQSPMWQIAGEEFIYKAFEYAREADPSALLLYNDYDEADPEKSKQIFALVKRMKDAGVPVDGIGMQGHYDIFNPTPEEVDLAISQYKKLVNHIHITELDVRLHPGNPPDWREEISESKRKVRLSEREEEQQIRQYVEYFRVFMKHTDVIDCVSFWNLGDLDSWLGVANYALLFDVDYNPKRSYYAIMDLAGDYGRVDRGE